MARNPNKVGVWQSLRNAWKVQDIRKDYARVQASMGSNTLPLLDLVNMMTGSNFQNMTIMAMGITPYINSSIIMQLLTIAIPALERLQKSGPEGQKKIAAPAKERPRGPEEDRADHPLCHCGPRRGAGHRPGGQPWLHQERLV